MIPVKALKSACGSKGTETDRLRLCVVARLCQGCVGTCSSRVLTLSPAAPEGPLTCNGGLVKAQRDDGTEESCVAGDAANSDATSCVEVRG